METNKQDWEREFGVLFTSKEFGGGGSKVYADPQDIKSFIKSLLSTQEEKIRREERRRLVKVLETSNLTTRQVVDIIKKVNNL